MFVIKKRLLLLCITLWLQAAWLVPTVFADAGAVSLSASGAAKAGERVELTVTLTGATAVRGIAVTPTYDKTHFTLKAGQWLATGPIRDFSVETGDGVIAFDAPTDVSDRILTFTLQIGDGTPAGEYTVGCSVVVNGESGNQTLTAQTTVTVGGTQGNTDEQDRDMTTSGDGEDKTVTPSDTSHTTSTTIADSGAEDKGEGSLDILWIAGVFGGVLLGAVALWLIKKKK